MIFGCFIRYILIGSIDGMITVLTVVYTERNNYFRIISARKSNEKERRLYYGSHR
ncbi:MAG: BrnT family toxin [Lachnospiraceae bacterium]|nr:BrnT family toxin [Lachnospiraceae bacterium]